MSHRCTVNATGAFKLLATATIFLLATQSEAAPAYKITELVTWGSVGGINNAGEAVGNRLVETSNWDLLYSVFSYSPGNGVTLRPSTDPLNDRYLDINDAGQILTGVGLMTNGTLAPHDSRILPLSSDTELQGVARLNQLGQYTGAARFSDTAAHAYLATKDGLTDLGSLESQSWSFGKDLNNNGHVVGMARIGQTVHGFIYSNGTMTDIGTLGNEQNYGQFYPLSGSNPYSIAYAINDADQVVGMSNFSSFIYQNGTMSELPKLSGASFSAAYGINSRGDVVGTMVGEYANGFLYSNGQTHSINELLSPEDAANWSFEYAWDINDRGQIIGSGHSRQTLEWTTFVATPVPEPSSIALILGGLWVCGAEAARNQRRRRATPN